MKKVTLFAVLLTALFFTACKSESERKAEYKAFRDKREKEMIEKADEQAKFDSLFERGLISPAGRGTN